MARELPQRIGRYEIVRPIGAGGMGEVFLARDPTIDRALAVKRVLLGHTDEAEELKQRLLREARAAGRLIHPHVVTLFDAGEAEDGLFLAFELVDGPDLGRRMKSPPPLVLREVLEIARQVASALDYAHGEGIVHRDIKPGNILIGSRGEAKVADFGLAKLHGESMELTRTGSVVGSPQYMSPEQVRGETLDGRSDLFSFGVVLYEMLSRERPFGGQTISTLVYEILSKEPVDIADLRPDLSPRLATLVRGLLAKQVTARPANAAAVLAELEALQREIPPALLAGPVVTVVDDDAPTARVPTGFPSLPPSAATVGPPAASSTPPAASPSPPPSPHPSPPTVTPPPVATGQGVDPTLRLDQSPIPASGPPTPPSGLSTETVPPPPPSGPSFVPPPPPPGSGSTSRAIPAPIEQGDTPRQRASWVAIAVLALAFLVVAAGGLYFAYSVVMPYLTQNSQQGSGEESGGDDGSQAMTDDGGQDGGGQGDRSGNHSGTEAGSETDGESGGGSGTEPDLDISPERGLMAGGATSGPRSGPEAVETGKTPTGPTPGGPRIDPPTPPGKPPAPPPDDRPGGGTTPPPPVDPPPVDRPEPEIRPRPEPRPTPTGDPALAEFDQAAAGARHELRGSRFLRFQVDPPEAYVRAWRRGEERGWVLGKAEEFAAGEKKAGSAELPEAGDYLLTLVADGWPEVTILVHAETGQGPAPQVVVASLKKGQAGPTVLRVERSVAFDGTPADARVLVDGVAKGIASEWPGGLRATGSRNLQLDPGRHVVRLEAPGRKPFEIEVEVISTAAKKTDTIHYRLEPR